ncbi:MAG: hypothetical protein LGB66_00485 [Sulfurovum sp.]|nr:hypothetical protein [Sulfurovum sp.]MCB4765664.1 hypothetical protein [Sulfurovum sp.]
MKIENYNNIGIGLVALLSVIRNFKDLDYSKALLIQPLLLHNPLVNYVKKSNVIINGIEDLTLSKVEYFLNYNDRYFSLLPLSINTILVAEKMKFLKLEDSKIIVNKSNIETFDFQSTLLGTRAKNIILASERISQLLKEESKELYFKLRVEV